MRNISITMLAALCVITVVSCQSASPKMKACTDACAANKTGCYDRAKEKKGHIDAKKKTKCDVDSKACSNDCARKFR